MVWVKGGRVGGWVEKRVGIFIVPQHERNSLAQLGLVIFVS